MKLSIISFVEDLFFILLEYVLHARLNFHTLSFLVESFLFHFRMLLFHFILEIRLGLFHRDYFLLHICQFFCLFVEVYDLSGITYVVFGDAQPIDLSFESRLIDHIRM